MTFPFQLLVARTDSRCGTWMIFDGFWSLFPPLIWNSENEHGWQVFHCASAAAIFIGWKSVSTIPRWLPTMMASREPGTRSTIASRADRWNTAGLDPLRRCQADTASITTAAVTSEASSTWRNPHTNTVLVRTAQMSVSCARPVALLIV